MRGRVREVLHPATLLHVERWGKCADDDTWRPMTARWLWQLIERNESMDFWLEALTSARDLYAGSGMCNDTTGAGLLALLQFVDAIIEASRDAERDATARVYRILREVARPHLNESPNVMNTSEQWVACSIMTFANQQRPLHAVAADLDLWYGSFQGGTRDIPPYVAASALIVKLRRTIPKYLAEALDEDVTA